MGEGESSWYFEVNRRTISQEAVLVSSKKDFFVQAEISVEGGQLCPERIVWFHSDLAALQVLGDVAVELGVIGKQGDVAARGEKQVRVEHGVVLDIGATQVQQPRDLVQGADNETVGIVFLDDAGNALDLGCGILTGKLDVQGFDDAVGGGGNVLELRPDLVNQVFLDRHEFNLRGRFFS